MSPVQKKLWGCVFCPHNFDHPHSYSRIATKVPTV